MKITNNVFKSTSFENPLFNNFSADVLTEILNFHQTVPGYKETPLYSLNGFSSRFGIGRFMQKTNHIALV